MNRNIILSVLVAATLGLALSAPGLPALAQTLEALFTADRWELTGATLVEHLGRQALRGTALSSSISR